METFAARRISTKASWPRREAQPEGCAASFALFFRVGVSGEEGGEDIGAVAAGGPEDGCHSVAVGGFDGGVGGEEDVHGTGVVWVHHCRCEEFGSAVIG